MNVPADIYNSTLIYMQIAVTNRYVNAFCPYPHFYYGACSAEVGKSRLKFSGSYFLWSYLLSRCQSNKVMHAVSVVPSVLAGGPSVITSCNSWNNYSVSAEWWHNATKYQTWGIRALSTEWLVTILIIIWHAPRDGRWQNNIMVLNICQFNAPISIWKLHKNI